MEEQGTEDCVLDVEEEGHGSDGGGSELASSVDTLLDNTYFDDEDLNEEQTCKRCVTIFDNREECAFYCLFIVKHWLHVWIGACGDSVGDVRP